MDPSKTANANSEESVHITEELYKKNLELAQVNRTLTLLRKIDEIILSSVTDMSQIAQQVANAIVEEDIYRLVIILLLDKDKIALKRLAVSQNDEVVEVEKAMPHVLHTQEVALESHDKVLVDAIALKKMNATVDMYKALIPHCSIDEAKAVQDITHVKENLIYPLVVRGEVIGVMILGITDIWDNLSLQQKDLSDRLSDVIGIALDNALLYQSIQEANERLKALDKAKDEFVSLASHELRTPMTVIKSYVWLLLQGNKGPLTDKQKQYLDRTYQTTDRLINLVNDMLNISRIESGRMTINPSSVDPIKLIDDTLIEIAPKAQELNIRLVFEKPPTQLPFVYADSQKIKEVLINLIGNSLKFTPVGGTVTVFVRAENQMILFEIADTGRGISAEDIPKLFQKFNIVGNEYLTKQAAQSTGLGLYLSKSLIELHGGKIWVTSEGLGRGSQFYFTLKAVSQ